MPGVEGSIPLLSTHSPATDRSGPMLTFRTHGRRWLAIAIAAALVGSLTVVLLRPMLERSLRERIESVARRHGMVAQMGSVHVGVWPFLRLKGFDLDLGHGSKLHADMIAATYPGRLRLEVRAANLVGPAGVELGMPATAWYVSGLRGDDLRLTLVEPQSGLSIRQQSDSERSEWNVEAHALDIGRLVEIRREGRPLIGGGIADGRLNLQSSTDALHFDVDIGSRGTRFG